MLKKIFTEAADIEGGICSFTHWLPSAFINKVRTRNIHPKKNLQKNWKVHMMTFDFKFGCDYIVHKPNCSGSSVEQSHRTTESVFEVQMLPGPVWITNLSMPQVWTYGSLSKEWWKIKMQHKIQLNNSIFKLWVTTERWWMCVQEATIRFLNMALTGRYFEKIQECLKIKRLLFKLTHQLGWSTTQVGKCRCHESDYILV